MKAALNEHPSQGRHPSRPHPSAEQGSPPLLPPPCIHADASSPPSTHVTAQASDILPTPPLQIRSLPWPALLRFGRPVQLTNRTRRPTANSSPGGGLVSVSRPLARFINKHSRHPPPPSCDSLLSLSFSSCPNSSSPTRHRHCSSPSLARQTACTRPCSRVAFQSTGKFHVCTTSLSHTTGVAEDKNAM